MRLSAVMVQLFLIRLLMSLYKRSWVNAKLSCLPIIIINIYKPLSKLVKDVSEKSSFMVNVFFVKICFNNE